jgi:phosphoribosylamine-glycine ligase
MRICSSSKRLIDDIQELFLKIGKVGTISVDKRKRMLNPINKKYYSARPIYAIEVKKRQKASIRKNNIRWVEYDGYIGCVTVSTGFVIVRRNSRVAISGNTGGMGSYSDAGYILPFLKQEDYDEGISIMKASVEAFRKETGEDYRGFLYGGFMVTKDGVRLLEYNARLGDPEAMNTLSVIKSDFLEILERIVDGSLKDASFEKKATVCKYLVPEGYPVSPKKNELIEVDEGAIQRSGAMLYYASVNEIDGKIYTGSSRTAGLVGIADTIENAERIAEGAMKFVKGKLFYRKDIGTRELIQKRIGHMKKLRGQ